MDARRDAILAALGGTDPPASEPPHPLEPSPGGDDPVRALAEALERAGGRLVRLPDRAALERALAAATEAARSVWTPDAPSGDERPAPALAVLRGGPAVAESGAVWWCPGSTAERRAGFLAEHVILVVEASQVVPDLHAAYRRIEPAAAAFGCFVAGPSKTADIEQALVIGAHGPRRLEVLLWGAG